MKKFISKMDKPLLFMMLLYSVLGLIVILSASSVSAVLRYGVSSYYFFIRQLIFVGLSFFVGVAIVLRIPTTKYKVFTPILIIGIIASLVGLFFYGIVSNNAQSWYRIGFFNLQPAEFAKSILIIYILII